MRSILAGTVASLLAALMRERCRREEAFGREQDRCPTRGWDWLKLPREAVRQARPMLVREIKALAAECSAVELARSVWSFAWPSLLCEPEGLSFWALGSSPLAPALAEVLLLPVEMADRVTAPLKPPPMADVTVEVP